jgi:hypothetical protein
MLLYKTMAEVGCLKDGCFQNLQVDGQMYHAGIDLVPNGIATTALGLNPTWRLNFGGATLAAGDNTTDAQMLDVLTPVSTLHRLSLALIKVAKQGFAVTTAQASQIFGTSALDAGVGSVTDMTGGTVATNLIPATLKVNTIIGTTAANLTLDDSATDLAGDLDQSMILFNNYVLENSHVLTIGFHANNEHHAASCEVICTSASQAGTDQFTRQTATTNGHQDLIMTATGDTTVLPGSYIYLQSGADTDEMTIKSCIRTTGGTIAVTFAN